MLLDKFLDQEAQLKFHILLVVHLGPFAIPGWILELWEIYGIQKCKAWKQNSNDRGTHKVLANHKICVAWSSFAWRIYRNSSTNILPA